MLTNVNYLFATFSRGVASSKQLNASNHPVPRVSYLERYPYRTERYPYFSAFLAAVINLKTKDMVWGTDNSYLKKVVAKPTRKHFETMILMFLIRCNPPPPPPP